MLWFFFADQISWFVDENMDLALSYGEDMHDFVTQYKHLFNAFITECIEYRGMV